MIVYNCFPNPIYRWIFWLKPTSTSYSSPCARTCCAGRCALFLCAAQEYVYGHPSDPHPLPSLFLAYRLRFKLLAHPSGSRGLEDMDSDCGRCEGSNSFPFRRTPESWAAALIPASSRAGGISL
jgi:hypothetical protein